MYITRYKSLKALVNTMLLSFQSKPSLHETSNQQQQVLPAFNMSSNGHGADGDFDFNNVMFSHQDEPSDSSSGVNSSGHAAGVSSSGSQHAASEPMDIPGAGSGGDPPVQETADQVLDQLVGSPPAHGGAIFPPGHGTR